MKNALFIAGGWVGHEPQECCEIFAGLLKENGYSTEISNSLDVLEDREKLAAQNLIIPCWTMGEISKEAEDNVCGVVREGVGLGGWHGGMCDAFRNAPTYQYMTGGQWVAHPGGNTVSYRVSVRDQLHPITEGISSWDMTSEQYYMHVDPGVSVLATTVFTGAVDSWIDGVAMPMAWTKSWGNGRVFYAAPGHTAKDFDYPELRQLTLNGLLWASS